MKTNAKTMPMLCSSFPFYLIKNHIQKNGDLTLKVSFQGQSLLFERPSWLCQDISNVILYHMHLKMIENHDGFIFWQLDTQVYNAYTISSVSWCINFQIHCTRQNSLCLKVHKVLMASLFFRSLLFKFHLKLRLTHDL